MAPFIALVVVGLCTCFGDVGLAERVYERAEQLAQGAGLSGVRGRCSLSQANYNQKDVGPKQVFVRTTIISLGWVAPPLRIVSKLYPIGAVQRGEKNVERTAYETVE